MRILLDSLRDDVRRHASAFLANHSADTPVIFESLIAAEDHRAREHDGVDWLSIARAVVLAPCERGVRGVSTIEQQLVRTLIPRTRRHIKAKLKELLLARQLARAHTKEELWSAYLHAAYYGPRHSYETVRALFCRPSSQLTADAASQIVALLKYPLRRDGIGAPQPSQTRRASHIRSLQVAGIPRLRSRISFRMLRCWERFTGR
jgi:membrane peptidoglycan carboxypeptidase